jgi:uncharacterized protein (TIGR03435 family)
MRAYGRPRISGVLVLRAGGVVTYDIVRDRLIVVESEPAGAFEQTRLRLQALLADRFQLQIHRESKELPVYELGRREKPSPT